MADEISTQAVSAGFITGASAAYGPQASKQGARRVDIAVKANDRNNHRRERAIIQKPFQKIEFFGKFKVKRTSNLSAKAIIIPWRHGRLSI
ncbi:MAG: hypothetical protein AB9866_13085 [Syntrophobacteraceae bacterium]